MSGQLARVVAACATHNWAEEVIPFSDITSDEQFLLLNEIILLEIYPARELPIAGVNSQMLLDKINSPHKKLLSKEEVLQYIGAEGSCVVLLTLGAGDITKVGKELIEHVLEK